MIPLRGFLLTVLAVVVLGGGLWWLNGRDTRKAGADDAAMQRVDSALKAFAARQDTAHRVLVYDTTVFHHKDVHLDSTLHHVTITDTTAVRAALAEAASTVAACRLSLSDALHVVSLCDSTRAALERKVALLEHSHRPRISPYLDAGWSLTDRAPALVGGADYRLWGDRLTLRATLAQSFAPHEAPRAFAGAHWAF